MRELMESLRQETTSRVRMLKERLDRTDRELLRQLEESQNNDRSDKFDALAAMIETKADKALTERWLEASQQLHGELQTVHVRTQTLGQGMKVVLGWVEGMADKVTGLQGAQHRMAQQVSQQREELQPVLERLHVRDRAHASRRHRTRRRCP
jgi:predicted  nucleic acid-binding Zn-ribbon protein